MIIKSIELENIRSYKKELIEFKEGINFLSGDIGSGKSSVLLAIEFALLGFKRGDLEGFQLLRKGSSSGYIKLKILNTKTQKEIEICRNLKKSGTSDSITQAGGFIFFDNNLVELSANELNDYIFNLLSFPLEFLSRDKNLIYRFTVYTPQEQLKEILFTEPDKRLELIRKVFNIDKYKQLQDGLGIYSNKVREEKKVMQSKLEPLLNIKEGITSSKKEVLVLEKGLRSCVEKEEFYSSKLQKHKSAIKLREDKLEDLEREILVLEKKLSKVDEIKKTVKSLKDDVLDKQKKIDSILQDNYSSKIKNLRKIIGDFEKELNSIDKEQAEFETRLKDYDILHTKKENLIRRKLDYDAKNQKILDMQKQFDYVLTKCQRNDLQNFIARDKLKMNKFEKIESCIKVRKEELFELELKLKRLDEDYSLNESRISALDEMDVCDSCMQKVSEQHKVDMKLKIQEVLKNMVVNKKEVILKCDKVKHDILQDEKVLCELGDVRSSLIVKEERLLNLLEKESKEKELYLVLKDLKKQVLEFAKNDFEKEILKCDEQVKTLNGVREKVLKLNDSKVIIGKKIGDLRVEISDLEKRILERELFEKEILVLEKSIAEKLKELEGEEEVLDRLGVIMKEKSKLKEESERLNINLEKLHENLRLVSNKSSSIKADIENLNKFVSSKEKEVEELSFVEKNFKKLLEMESFLNRDVSSICSIIEKSIFTKYYALFNEEFERLFHVLIEDNDIDVRLDSDFSPVIEQNGYDIGIKNLSGGEKSSLAIAYRLGLKTIIENNLSGNSKLSLLILDEPTDGFSNNQVERLGSILKGSMLKQIILVSHDDKIESISDIVLNIGKVNHESFLVR